MIRVRLLRLKFRLWLADRLLDLATWCGERAVSLDGLHRGEEPDGTAGRPFGLGKKKARRNRRMPGLSDSEVFSGERTRTR
jgi:hypothetical protein